MAINATALGRPAEFMKSCPNEEVVADVLTRRLRTAVRTPHLGVLWHDAAVVDEGRLRHLRPDLA